MKTRLLIVGSGVSVATLAYKATQARKKCLAIDKRPMTKFQQDLWEQAKGIIR